MNTLLKNRLAQQSKYIFILLVTFYSFDAYTASVGEKLYLQNCMVCHADDGSGAMPGVIDLAENRTWSTIPEQQLLSRLKKGIQTPGAAVIMPAKGGNPNLTDRDLLAIITYMRESFLK